MNLLEGTPRTPSRSPFRVILLRTGVAALLLASLASAEVQARIRFTGAAGTDVAGVASAEAGVWFSSATHRDWQPALGAGEDRTHTTVLATSDGFFLVGADDGTVWRSTTTLGNAFTLRATLASPPRALLETGARVLAVGDDGFIARSSDLSGGSWVTVDPGGVGAASLYAVAANGSASTVAVGEGGTVLRAGLTGANWEEIATGETRTLRGIVVDAFGNYLAVGDGGAAWRATADGLNWTPVDVGSTANLRGVDRVGQAVVVVGDGGTILYSAANLANWTRQTAPSFEGVSSYDLYAVAGTGTPDWIAVGSERVTLFSVLGTVWLGSDVTPVLDASWGRIKQSFAR